MTNARGFLWGVLPKRIHEAWSVLKHGLPPDATPGPVSPVTLVANSDPAPSLEKAGAAPPRSSVRIPSMITGSEAEFFTECARGPLPPDGTVVDLGCFMGSTAVALAEGIAQSGRRDEIFAYDLFEWAEWMNGSITHGDYRPGDTFLSEARGYARLRSWARQDGTALTSANSSGTVDQSPCCSLTP